MTFISTFKEYSSTRGNNIPTFLWKNEENLLRLINTYSNNKKINNFLLKELEKYDIKDEDYINRRNLIEVIKSLNDKGLLDLNIKSEIIRELKIKIIQVQKLGLSYSEAVLEIDLFFQLSPSFKDVKSIFSESLSIDWYDYFLIFCVNTNNRKFFEYLMAQYNEHYEDEIDKTNRKFYFLQEEEYLDYILSNKKTNIKFIKSLIDKPKVLNSLLKGHYITKEKILTIFSNGEKKDVQLCIFTIIKEYSENKNYSFDRLFKDDLLGYIIELQNDDFTFVDSIFSYLNIGDNQYISIGTVVLKSLMTTSTFNLFTKYNRGRRTILSLYYSFENNTEKGGIKQLIYDNFGKIITENELKNDEFRKESLEKLTEKEEKIKNEIKELIDNDKHMVEKTKLRYFVGNILYLFKDYKELFEDSQIEFVKEQINLYFTSQSTNPGDPKCKITYPRENSFSWPRFIPDLQLCLEIVIEENFIDLLKYKERVSYLIPYLFSSSLSLVIKRFKENKEIINDKKIVDWFLDVYLHKQNQGLGYLHPSRLISLIDNGLIKISNLDSEQKIKLSKICENMVISNHINVSVRDKIEFIHFISNNFLFLDSSWLIEFYENFGDEIWKFNYFDDYLKGKLGSKDGERFLFFTEINETVIKIFKNSDAIKWRLDQLIGIKTEVVESSETGIHSIDRLESELIWGGKDDTYFYSVLIEKLKFGEYENEIKNILKHAKSFKAKYSATRNYLYKFVAAYYKLVPDNKKIEVYSKIKNKDFVILFLGASYWGDKEKIEFKIKKNQTILEMKYISKIKKQDKKIKRLENGLIMKENEILQLRTKINSLEKENKNLKQNFKIITEGESDWRHLLKMAESLRVIHPEKTHIYDFFINYVLRYETTLGDGKDLNFIEILAAVDKNVKVIGVFDTDGIFALGNSKRPARLKDYVPDGCENILMPNSGVKNLRIVTLTHPWAYDENLNYYENFGWCIELFYNKERLSDYFFIPRDCNPEIIAESPDLLLKGNYKNKEVYMGLIKNVYDRNGGCPALYMLKSEKDKFMKNLKSKKEFAKAVEDGLINLSTPEITIFDPLFEIIYEAGKKLGYIDDYAIDN